MAATASHILREFKLVFYALGIFGCYFVFGLYQEKMYVNILLSWKCFI